MLSQSSNLANDNRTTQHSLLKITCQQEVQYSSLVSITLSKAMFHWAATQTQHFSATFNFDSQLTRTCRMFSDKTDFFSFLPGDILTRSDALNGSSVFGQNTALVWENQFQNGSHEPHFRWQTILAGYFFPKVHVAYRSRQSKYQMFPDRPGLLSQ